MVCGLGNKANGFVLALENGVTVLWLAQFDCARQRLCLVSLVELYDFRPNVSAIFELL
jgi:hypothetical protein